MKANETRTVDLTSYRACSADDIPERGRVLVDAGGVQIGIFRIHGRLYAYENRCSHQGGPVCRGDVLGRWEEQLDSGGRVISAGFSEDRVNIACPWHGYEYDLESGAHISDPRIKLRSFEVSVRDGDVFVVAPSEVDS